MSQSDPLGEDWLVLKNLKAKNCGKSNRAVARDLGIGLNTTKAALGRNEAPEYR